MQGKAGRNQIPDMVTITEASRFLERDPKTVRKRIKNINPIDKEGNCIFYPTYDIIRSVLVEEVDEKKSEMTLAQARTELCIEQALKTRLEREKLAEKYIDVEYFTLCQAKRFLSFKEKLLNVASKLGPKVIQTDSETATSIISFAIREALTELVEEEIAKIDIQKESFDENYGGDEGFID